MADMFTRISKNQSGFILIYVTLTLVVAIIILPAILLFIGGAGRSAQIREDRMLQVYAADAGIEKAFHEIVIHQPQPQPGICCHRGTFRTGQAADSGHLKKKRLLDSREALMLMFFNCLFHTR